MLIYQHTSNQRELSIICCRDHGITVFMRFHLTSLKRKYDSLWSGSPILRLLKAYTLLVYSICSSVKSTLSCRILFYLESEADIDPLKLGK